MFSIFKRDSEDTITANELDNLIGTIDLMDIREHMSLKEGISRQLKTFLWGNCL